MSLTEPPVDAGDSFDLTPPEADEVRLISRGIASAAAGPDGLTDLQQSVLGTLTAAMTGHQVDYRTLEPIDPGEFGRGLAHRAPIFRLRLLQVMELGHMILPTPSVDVADSIIRFANEMKVSDRFIHDAREFAEGSRRLIAADFDRTAYLGGLDLSAFTPLRTADDNVYAWTSTVVRPQLAARWRALGDLPAGTLGRGVFDFYEARGFRFPGEEGSAPPLLAQHDWVHVIADYGSTVESELEVFGFIARASDDPAAFALLAMVINLFQTGNVDNAAGLFQADPGHLDADGMPERLADALRRGALTTGSVDFLATDFWSIAADPIDDVRDRFGVVPKSDDAVAAGSPGPWEPGGISPFQLDDGKAYAAEQHREYDPHGASALD